MPKFKITTDSGQGPETDGEPLDFPHAKAAEHDAQLALTEMCRESLPNDRRADFGIKIEDDVGNQVYKAALHFEAERNDDKSTASDIAAQQPNRPPTRAR